MDTRFSNSALWITASLNSFGVWSVFISMLSQFCDGICCICPLNGCHILPLIPCLEFTVRSAPAQSGGMSDDGLYEYHAHYDRTRVIWRNYGTKWFHVRFQVLTAASMMFRVVFSDVLPCKIIFDRRFGGTYCLHHQGWFHFRDRYLACKNF
jgi:hypothetical protein